MNTHLNTASERAGFSSYSQIDDTMGASMRKSIVAHADSLSVIETLTNALRDCLRFVEHLPNNREIKEIIAVALSPEPAVGELFVYKNKEYKVVNVDKNRLIQFNEIWHPAIEYVCYPDIGKTFYRALPDFNDKFRRVIHAKNR